LLRELINKILRIPDLAVGIDSFGSVFIFGFFRSGPGKLWGRLIKISRMEKSKQVSPALPFFFFFITAI